MVSSGARCWKWKSIFMTSGANGKSPSPSQRTRSHLATKPRSSRLSSRTFTSPIRLRWTLNDWRGKDQTSQGTCHEQMQRPRTLISSLSSSTNDDDDENLFTLNRNDEMKCAWPTVELPSLHQHETTIREREREVNMNSTVLFLPFTRVAKVNTWKCEESHTLITIHIDDDQGAKEEEEEAEMRLVKLSQRH